MTEKNVRCLYRAVVIAVLAVGLPLAGHANLIANGDFSSPALAYGATYCACSPSEANAIIDWTITVGNVDLVPGGTSAYGVTWEPPPGGGRRGPRLASATPKSVSDAGAGGPGNDRRRASGVARLLPYRYVIVVAM
jgi:hypothetical protein